MEIDPFLEAHQNLPKEFPPKIVRLPSKIRTLKNGQIYKVELCHDKDRSVRVTCVAAPSNILLYAKPELVSQIIQVQFEVTNTTEGEDWVLDQLKHGIQFKGTDTIYKYLGNSNSQRTNKEIKTCYMLDDRVDVQKLLLEYGEFSTKCGEAKRAKRIGLLFTTLICAFTLEEDVAQKTLNDIRRNEYIFTDGCGFISSALLEELWKKKKLKQPIPSVVQVRYPGKKGVLIKKKATEKFIEWRKSMEKITSTLQNPFGMVDWSKPHQYGSLNEQIIMLLLTLGVPEKTIEEKQRAYYNSVLAIPYSPADACKWAIVRKKQGLINPIKQRQASSESLQKLQQQEFEKSGTLGKKPKIKIPLFYSRNLFGVCDPTSSLQYGECFVRITMADDKPRALVGNVIVTRNPCYHPGDIRVLKAVLLPDKVWSNNLVDCIVFPTNGDRPHPDEMSGGDLDGDKYFVCWDPDIVPKVKPVPPSNYSSETTGSSSVVNQSQMLRYFLEKDALLGQIDSAFLRFAKSKGVSCDQCQELARAFSRSVDFSKEDSERIKALFRDSKSCVIPLDDIWTRMLWYMKNWNSDVQRQVACVPFTEDRDICLLYSALNTFGDTFSLERFTAMHEELKPVCSPNLLLNPRHEIALFCTAQCKERKCKGIHPEINIKELQQEVKRQLEGCTTQTRVTIQTFEQSITEITANLQSLEEQISERTILDAKYAANTNDIEKYKNQQRTAKQKIQEVNSKIANLKYQKSQRGLLGTIIGTLFGDNTEADLEVRKKKEESTLEQIERKLDACVHNIRLLETRRNSMLSSSLLCAEKDSQTKVLNARSAKLLQAKKLLAFTEGKVERQLQKMYSGDRDKQLECFNHIERYFRQLQAEKPLPIASVEETIIRSVQEFPLTIISAATGSGKSTQIVQFLLDAGIPSTGVILCVQPKVLAAWSLAERVSEEMRYEPGEMVVYHTSKGNNAQHNARIKFVTTGIFMKMTEQPDFIDLYPVILIDELHERTIEIDVGLAILHKLLPQHKDLRVILMSATITPQPYIKYFGAKYTNTISVDQENTNYPINVIYKDEYDMSRDIVSNVVDATHKIVKEIPTEDMVLVFLPGRQEVQRAVQRAGELIKDSHIIGITGGMSKEDCDNELKKSEKRKIIFSTNVAETSITFDKLKVVIDPGKEKGISYRPGGNSWMSTRSITKASADQRKGRVGRTSPGSVYRLYSEAQYKSLEDYRSPEILTKPSHELLLKLKATKRDNLQFINWPSQEDIESAEQLLYLLGATDDKGIITKLGQQLAQLPVPLKMGKALITSCRLHCSEEICKIAAMCSVGYYVFKQDLNQNEQLKKFELHKLQGDHEVLLQLFDLLITKTPEQPLLALCNKNQLKKISERYKAIKKAMQALQLPLRSVTSPELLSENIARSLCSGFFQNTCMPNHKTIKGGYTEISSLHMPKCSAVLHPSSVLTFKESDYESTWVVYNEALTTSNNYLRIVTRIKPHWLQEEAAEWWKTVITTPEAYVEEVLTFGPLLRSKLLASKAEQLNELRKTYPRTVIHIPEKDSISPVLLYSPEAELHGARNYLMKWKEEIIRQDTLECYIDCGKVTIGSGMEIKAVHSSWSKLRFIYASPDLNSQDIKELFQMYGKFARFACYPTHEQKLKGYVIWNNMDAAQQAKHALIDDPLWTLYNDDDDPEALRHRVILFPDPRYITDHSTQIAYDHADELYRYKDKKGNYVVVMQCRSEQDTTNMLNDSRIRTDQMVKHRFFVGNRFLLQDIEKERTQLPRGIKLEVKGISIQLTRGRDTNLEVLIQACKTIAAILEPTIVRKPLKYLLQIKHMFDAWMEEYRIHIVLSVQQGHLLVSGLHDNRARFIAFFQKISEQDMTIYSPPLSFNQKAIKLILKWENFCNTQIASVNVREGTVILKASSQRKLDKAVKKFQQMSDCITNGTNTITCFSCLHKNECCVLNFCGHYCCAICVQRNINQRRLPLRCKCGDPIALSDLSQLGCNPKEISREVLEMHITDHPDQFMRCPTANCKYVFVTAEKRADTCPLCGIRRILLTNKMNVA